MVDDFPSDKAKILADKIRNELGMQKCKDLTDEQVVAQFCIVDNVYPDIPPAMVPKVIAFFDHHKDLASFRNFLRHLRSCDNRRHRLDREFHLTLAYMDTGMLQHGLTDTFCEVRRAFQEHESAIPYGRIEAMVDALGRAKNSDGEEKMPRTREALGRLFEALWQSASRFDPVVDSLSSHKQEMNQLRAMLVELNREIAASSDFEAAARIDHWVERIAVRGLAEARGNGRP